ncbi:nitroreductase family protein [Nonomuraea sp. NPDC049400]|uniref:nitroreductase family protein n=1 Tax=Nonomuraea sp. NPDC049400 TaxID=3364352 RepID=UPI0037B1E346
MRSPSVPLTFTADEAHEHLTALLREPTSVNPPDWRIDWADGPWPIKVYARGERVPLKPGPLSKLLNLSLAVARVRFAPGGLAPTPSGRSTAPQGPRLVMRRPIPSGGSMYPTECYVLESGSRAWHYDPYRHELTGLGRPEAATALRRSLGLDDRALLPTTVLILTSRFWKNFYKYGEFAYRLGGIDAGVALGRLVTLGRAEYGKVDVRTEFADAVLNDGLGLDGRDESAYAVIGLGPAQDSPVTAVNQERPPVLIERSRRIKRSPVFEAIQAAARRREPPSPRDFSEESAGRSAAPSPADMVRRTSNGSLFNGRTAGRAALLTVLLRAEQALAELRAVSDVPDLVTLHCAVRAVEEVAPGWYHYRQGRLTLAEGGDPARELQRAVFADNINVELAAFTVHVAAPGDVRPLGGARAHRQLQLGVGVAVDALTLAATSAGLGSHTLLGFDVTRVAEHYDLPDDRAVQAQVCAGPTRRTVTWEISVTQR